MRSTIDRPLMCRFLDAGITSGATCSGGRRPKSARARSRGKFGGRAGGRRYGDLIVAPVTMVGAKLARGDRDRVRCAAWKRATGIAGVAWSPSTRGRLVDWRGRGERDRRQRGASATERESGARWSGSCGLVHDVSFAVGVGRHLGSQPRANTSITIMRAPQRGHGQRSARGSSGVASGCCCGSAAGGSAPFSAQRRG